MKKIPLVPVYIRGCGTKKRFFIGKERVLSKTNKPHKCVDSFPCHITNPFYVRPDKAFNDWWVLHKKRPQIPSGHVIPILSAMQGHPESPRLWEKHADSVLCDLGLLPTVHKLCLYLGNIAGTLIIFKRQVDDFAIAAPDKQTANILLDLIDEQLSIPLKWQGLLNMFNGIDVAQTKDYIKVSCHTYINKFCEKYLNT